MTPQQVPGKRPVVPAPSEDDLDDVEEDEEDEDEDDEEGDEDDEDDEDDDEDEDDEPAPLRRPIPGKPKIGRPKKPQLMNKEDLRTIIVERFEQGWTSYEVFNWLNQENIIDETGEPLSVKQVGGYKSMVSSQRREAYVSGQAPPPLTGQMQPLPPDYVAPPMAPARPTQGSQQQPFNIPRPRTNLEIHYEKLEKAVADKNDAMAQIAVEGLYKEMEKDGSGGGGGMNSQLFALLQGQLAGNKGSSKLHELEQLTTIVKNLMPEQAQGESEAVGMARVMADTVEKVSKDAKDTILEVSGTKGKADNMGTCPNCKKIIPKDSLFCGYCGLNFQKVEDDEEEEEEEDEEEAAARKEQERIDKEKARRAELARRAVKAPAQPKPTAAPPQPPKAGTPPVARPPAATPPQVRPLEPPVQIGADGGVMTVTERASLLRDLKKLANFITNKDDPVLKTQALFKLGDDGDKKQTLFLAIVGRDLLLASARRMVQEHPTELSMFQNYIELCDSVDGHAWLDKCFEEIKALSKQYGVLLKREEAASMLAKMEAKLGFAVE